MRVVESAAEADVIVRIDSRNERKETGSVSTYANQSKDGRSATATTVPNDKYVRVLHGTLIAGEFQMPLQDESALSWRLAAKDMASDVDHWVKENYARLIEKRLQNSQAPAPPQHYGRVRPQSPRQRRQRARPFHRECPRLKSWTRWARPRRKWPSVKRRCGTTGVCRWSLTMAK